MTQKNAKKNIDLEKAREWLDSANDKSPVLASRQTTDRHNREFVEPEVFSLNDKEAIARVREKSKEFDAKYKSK